MRPGVYRLRVAALDSDGRQGTVDYDLVAGLLEAQPLRLSGLVLGTIYDSRFTPKLVFGTDQAAAVVVEVYGQAPGAITARADVVSVADGRVLNVGAAGLAAGTGSVERSPGACRLHPCRPGTISHAGRSQRRWSPGRSERPHAAQDPLGHVVLLLRI